MTSLLLFGANSPSGAAFLNLAGTERIWVAGRRCPPACPAENFLHCDLGDLSRAARLPPCSVVVSFAPIWLLVPFLAGGIGDLIGLRRVIACSSSSVITKRFASNRFDRELVQRLQQAQDQLLQTCKALGISCQILAPTLIYGQAGGFGDRNLSVLLKLLRRLPVLPVPADAGLRQPIHARQLAAAALHLVEKENEGMASNSDVPLLALGGDETMPYTTMLRRLQAAVPRSDPASRCRILLVPAPLFHAVIAPLLPLSPKTFEALMRISADLAGFTTVHSILGSAAEPFPVLPLAVD